MDQQNRRPPGYTLKQLSYFVAAADAGSIKYAAERIGISQPSISGAIAHLEQEFSIQLFVRQHARGLTLTSSGQTFLGEAKHLLQQADALYGLSGEGDAVLHGRLALGCLVTLAPMVVPELTQQFVVQHPQIELTLLEGDPRLLIDSLRRVDVDVAITYDLQVPPEIEFEPLAPLPPYVLVSRNHRLAQASSIALKALSAEPMILLDLPYSRRYFFGLFQSLGLQPNVHARSVNQEVVRTMVANGFGFTIANVRPKNLTARDGRELVALPLEGDHQPMTIGVATLRQTHKARVVLAFEQHCRALINHNQVPGMQLEHKP